MRPDLEDTVPAVCGRVPWPPMVRLAGECWRVVEG